MYASDARLTLTGGPFGEQQYQGLDAITGFYAHFCAFLSHTPLGIAQWTQDAGNLLAPNVLLSYEHVSFSRSPSIGRCSHAFTIKGDKIDSLDWTVYG